MIHPNGTWHHHVESTLSMAISYEDACAVEFVLAEALQRCADYRLVAPSYVEGVQRVQEFLHKRTRIIREVIERPSE